MRSNRLWACAALVVSLACLVGAASVAWATPHKRTRTFKLPLISCPGTGQLCPPVATLTTLRSASNVTVTYNAGSVHCSEIQLRLFVDGKRSGTTPFVGPSGTTTTTVRWPKDKHAHILGYEAKGKTGGCNAGQLVSWTGKITLTWLPTK